jgi:hypothetical protein
VSAPDDPRDPTSPEAAGDTAGAAPRERDGVARGGDPDAQPLDEARDAERAHARIAAAIARAGEAYAPRPDWQARVLAAAAAEAAGAPARATAAEPAPAPGPPTSAQATGPTRGRWILRWWWAIAAPAAAAAAAGLLVLSRGRDGGGGAISDGSSRSADARLAISLARGSAAPMLGSDEARLGDEIIARSGGPGRHRAVWIFRNDTALVAECAPAMPCAAGDGAEARYVIDRIGRYTVIGVRARAPIPPPDRGSLDRSQAAAVRAGAELEQRVIIVD